MLSFPYSADQGPMHGKGRNFERGRGSYGGRRGAISLVLLIICSREATLYLEAICTIFVAKL